MRINWNIKEPVAPKPPLGRRVAAFFRTQPVPLCQSDHYVKEHFEGVER